MTTNRWYAIFLTSFSLAFVIAVPIMGLSALFKEISADLDLTLVQVGTIWGMTSFSGFMILIIGGMLGDRLGLKPIALLAFCATGLASIILAQSSGFLSLTITTFLFTMVGSLLIVNLPKVTKIWFANDRFVLANSIMSTGMSVGFTIGAIISATFLSPLLGGWRNVFVFFGLISFIFGLIWFFTIHLPVEHPVKSLNAPPMGEAISHVIGHPAIWLLGLANLGFTGFIQGVSGYLSLYLHNMGWSVANSDGVFALFNIAGAFGAVPIALLSDRLGARKKVLSSLIIISIISTALLPFFDNWVVWPIAFIIGFTRDPAITLFYVMNMETKGISIIYAGTALGLMSTIGRVGGTIAPIIGNSFAGFGPGAPFYVWAAFSALALVFLYYCKDTGRRGIGLNNS